MQRVEEGNATEEGVGPGGRQKTHTKLHLHTLG
jgi:hypothetical protein